VVAIVVSERIVEWGPGIEPPCLICGTTLDALEHGVGLPPGQLRCPVCRAINDVHERSAPVLGSGELVLPPASTPSSMSVRVRRSRRAAGSRQRRNRSEPAVHVVVDWYARSIDLWAYFVVPVVMLLGGSLIFLGSWVSVLAVLGIVLLMAITYVIVEIRMSRFVLHVKGDRVALGRKGLPTPTSTKLVAVRVEVGSAAAARVVPQPIPAMRIRHVQLVLRRFESRGHVSSIRHVGPFDYYAVAVVDVAGRQTEHAISADIEEARFVFRVMTGFVPRSHRPTRRRPDPPRPRDEPGTLGDR
jgi:hypothetical protein